MNETKMSWQYSDYGWDPEDYSMWKDWKKQKQEQSTYTQLF